MGVYIRLVGTEMYEEQEHWLLGFGGWVGVGCRVAYKSSIAPPHPLPSQTWAIAIIYLGAEVSTMDELCC